MDQGENAQISSYRFAKDLWKGGSTKGGTICLVCYGWEGKYKGEAEQIKFVNC